MKMTNFVLVNIMSTLQKYSNLKLPQKISYAITKNLMKISKEYELYESQLKKIFDSYSDKMLKDENGDVKVNHNNVPIVSDDVSEEYNEQISDLLNIETDIEMYTIDMEAFNYDDKGVYDTMSAHDIMILQSILCKSDEEVV